MDKQDIASLRDKVEAKYQAAINRLDQERQLLEKWYAEKTNALDMLSGKKTVDDWLENSAVGQITLPLLEVHGRATHEKPKHVKPVINQAEEIRAAIFALKTNVTNSSVQKWLTVHRPSIHEFIQVRSIRSELWRLEKKGILKIVGKEGNAHIYEVFDRPAELAPPDSDLGDQN